MMTRVSKLAVTMWSVTALSGCASSMHQPDKPTSSSAAHTRPYAKNPVIDKNATSYIAARDSLQRVLQDETLAIMDAPLADKPMALPVTAIEKSVLQKARIKEISYADSCFTHLAEYFLVDGTLYAVPFVDCDEILYEARNSDYIQYRSARQDYVLRTADFRTMVDTYKAFGKSSGYEDAKLYLSFSNQINAYTLSLQDKKDFGLRPDIPVSKVLVGLLQNVDPGAVDAVLYHENGHEKAEERQRQALQAYAETGLSRDILRQNANWYPALRRYAEYQSDSTGFAARNAVGRRGKADAALIPEMKLHIRSYQESKRQLGDLVVDVLSNDTTPLSMSALQSINFQVLKENRDEKRRFTAPPKATYPTEAQRIYYLLIHQRRARELAENRESVLYRQYGDLLPKPPVINVTPASSSASLQMKIDAP